VLLGEGSLNLLEVKGIDVAYGYAKVLHNVSVKLHQGEMVFIVGRNGAGKTTLLQTISGLLNPTGGSIAYQGQEVQGQPPEKLARLGIRFVAQDKKVFSHLTVKDNLELAAYASGENLNQVKDRLFKLYPKFQEFLRRKAGGLSGGQREILLIGRALVGNPKILLIDEPTEGLAAVVIEEVFRILNEMKKNKVSTLIVEQNLSTVSRLADRIYIMKEGKIIKEMVAREEIANTAELENYL
jgi:ABC-type branched-subunit amino acid transport system ATPase component